jgi:hypothetical protein
MVNYTNLFTALKLIFHMGNVTNVDHHVASTWLNFKTLGIFSNSFIFKLPFSFYGKHIMVIIDVLLIFRAFCNFKILKH